MVSCATCGTANAPTDRFCGECGAALDGAEAASPSSSARGADPVADPRTAERRMVTILFADLVGFTTLAEDRDPETVRELLTRYFEVAADVIGRYGGTVEKFIGDAVMAVWGAPTAHEDDAERAVRAGLELIEAVRGLAIAGRPLEVRAGILTGEAAVTFGAVGQGMVAGDLVNTASRLQSVAPPGSVLVGEIHVSRDERGHRLRTCWRTAPQGQGRARTGVASDPGRRHDRRGRAARTSSSRRSSAARRSCDWSRRCSTRPRASDVCVSCRSSASRASARVAWPGSSDKYIDGISESIYWHQGRSPAYGEGITFWALGEMVRKRAGLVETDDAATTRATIAAALGEYVSR